MGNITKNKEKSKPTVLSYMSDVLFKDLLTRLNPHAARMILDFITLNIMGLIDHGLVVKNPNMNPSYFRQKDVTVDTFFESSQLSLIIEMQATKMCRNLWNRFIMYLSIVLSRFIHSGQKYKDVKPVCMILFTNHYDKRHPSLVVEKSWADEKFGTLVNQNCQKIYMIQIPYIEETIKTRRKLSDFEAFVYYLYFNHLENIEYVDKDGILKIMQAEKERFMEEEKDMYDEALERLKFTIDYDELLEDAVEEAVEEAVQEAVQEAVEVAIQETEEEISREKTLKLFKKFYPQEDTKFLNHLTLKQYTQVFDSLINDESIYQIKALCL